MVDNDVVRNTVLNTLLTKFRRVEAETSNANGVANKSQHGINKQNLGKNLKDVDNRKLYISRLVKNTGYNTKLQKLKLK